jgi:hypothetical protein
MDFNNQVLIVDVANIRDHASETMKTRKFEGREIPLSNLGYLDSALAALKSQVPSGTVLKVADFSLMHNFSDDERIEFKRRTNLEPTDPQYIYLLPFQPKTPQRRGGLFRRKPTDNPDFIEADDIILSLALELDAFVISGDSYSDEKFEHQMESIRDRLFVHNFNPETNSWVFVKSNEYYSEHREKRDAWDRIKSLTTIAQEIGDSRQFEMQSDFDIRDFAFNTLIEEFWENKRGRVTVDQDRHLVKKPFNDLLNGILIRALKDEAVPRELDPVVVSTAATSSNRELVPVNAYPELSKEIRVEHIELPMPTYYASAVHAILRHKDERIALMGKLVRDNSDFFIEWVLSDKRIKILAASTRDLPRTGELVRITGTVHQDNEIIYLEVGPRDTVVTVDLADIVEERVDNVRRKQPNLQRGYWVLPAMKWGGRRVTSSRPVVDSGSVPIPIPTSSPKPLPIIPKTLLVTESDVNPIRSGRSIDADWSFDPISTEVDGTQLFEPAMTTVNSFGRIEFLEPIANDRRVTKSGRLWKVLVLVALGLAAAFGLYLYMRQGSEIILPITGSGGASRLTMR